MEILTTLIGLLRDLKYPKYSAYGIKTTTTHIFKDLSGSVVPALKRQLLILSLNTHPKRASRPSVRATRAWVSFRPPTPNPPPRRTPRQTPVSTTQTQRQLARPPPRRPGKKRGTGALANQGQGQILKPITTRRQLSPSGMWRRPGAAQAPTRPRALRPTTRRSIDISGHEIWTLALTELGVLP